MVSVIILNWNEPLLENCLKSVFSQTIKDLEIIVVDNNSDQFNPVTLHKKFPKLKKIISLEENVFFSKGNNLGISESNGSHIVILNPDVILDKNYLKICLQCLKEDTQIGSVIGKLYRGKRFKPGWQKTNVIDETGTVIYKNRQVKERGEDEIDNYLYEKKEEVFSTCGAATVFRKNALESVRFNNEYYDEDFLMYKEDVDLGWRLRLAGWKIYYEPRALGYHIRGWTKNTQRIKHPLIRAPLGRTQVSKLKRYHSFKNRFLMILKNDSLKHFTLHFPWILATDLLMFLYILLFERFMLKAYIEILKILPKIVKKRAFIKNNLKIHYSEVYRFFK